MTKTATRKEMDAVIKEQKRAANPGRRGRVIATVEAIIIGTAVVLALGFALGDHYASSRTAQVDTAVKSAVSQLKAKQ